TPADSVHHRVVLAKDQHALAVVARKEQLQHLELGWCVEREGARLTPGEHRSTRLWVTGAGPDDFALKILRRADGDTPSSQVRAERGTRVMFACTLIGGKSDRNALLIVGGQIARRREVIGAATVDLRADKTVKGTMLQIGTLGGRTQPHAVGREGTLGDLAIGRGRQMMALIEE